MTYHILIIAESTWSIGTTIYRCDVCDILDKFSLFRIDLAKRTEP